MNFVDKITIPLLALILCFLQPDQIYAQLDTDDLNISSKVTKVSEDQIFKTEGYYNWGSSIIKDQEGVYHLFYSRWKKEYKFTGWLTHSE